ncbi:MAG: bifunctional 5,10-methylenetetrahydrofolate dehydrogenase/5,10-methenyltetrahydrofolate cyclohydrolase [Anaerolineae bacterium]|nr:bifunctional 5,10-methylenetetrahydrofolate dehydrogenase/5,10-methenyltetrahydrofolate cyclohydrolase [Anaerolineae bacterium]
MAATILDGRELAKTLGKQIEKDVSRLKEQHGVTPTVAVVRAGEDQASISYARVLKKSFVRHGMDLQLHILPEATTQNEVIALIGKLNSDTGVHGILVQEPLLKGLDEVAIKAALSPDKDVDGVHPINAGRLTQAAPVGRASNDTPFFVPATPAGGLEILKQYHVKLEGKRAVVAGRSSIVGKPMALLLLRENATVAICHSRTKDLADVCHSADILCSAVGRARFIKGEWIKPGAVVIDFGINFVDDAMCGDVDFEAAVKVAGMITPVPGGTGPMTSIMLMRNTIKAAGLRQET